MMQTVKKIHGYGYRRTLIYGVLRVLVGMKNFFYRYFLSDNTPNLSGAKFFTATQFVGRGSITIKDAQLGVWPSPYLLGNGYLEARSKEASICIGEDTVINNNFSIIADRTQIVIGKRCLIGPNFFAVDSDFHGLDVENRRGSSYVVGSVIVEDDVFIGDGVRILKSTRIGRGAVVASGAVVVCDVDSFCIYAGVPARKIGELNQSK
ncbi:acyltransferase [Limnohabitans sp.]